MSDDHGAAGASCGGRGGDCGCGGPCGGEVKDSPSSDPLVSATADLLPEELRASGVNWSTLQASARPGLSEFWRQTTISDTFHRATGEFLPDGLLPVLSRVGTAFQARAFEVQSKLPHPPVLAYSMAPFDTWGTAWWKSPLEEGEGFRNTLEGAITDPISPWTPPVADSGGGGGGGGAGGGNGGGCTGFPDTCAGVGGAGGGIFPVPVAPPWPPEDECKADKCDLEVYDNNDQLTSAGLKAILKKAAAKRKEAGEKFRDEQTEKDREKYGDAWADAQKDQTPGSGDPAAGENLGTYEGERQDVMWNAKLGARKRSTQVTYHPFMAIFTYDCPCTPSAELMWEKMKDGEWTADAPEFTKAATAENGESDKLDGACWKAVVDTPNKDGKWKITGKVEWKDNKKKCQEEWEVEIKGGEVNATKTGSSGKDKGKSRSSKTGEKPPPDEKGGDKKDGGK